MKPEIKHQVHLEVSLYAVMDHAKALMALPEGVIPSEVRHHAAASYYIASTLVGCLEDHESPEVERRVDKLRRSRKDGSKPPPEAPPQPPPAAPPAPPPEGPEEAEEADLP